MYAPVLSNRTSRLQWEAEGRPDIAAVARARALHIIARSKPPGLPEDLDARIRATFDIRW